jgi:soluble lytic murein transglycosylase-like protein
MRKRLQIALMVSPVLATFFSLTPWVWAAGGENASQKITTTTDENGRKIFTNDEYVPASQVKASSSSSVPGAGRNQLVYWSTTDKRWKPVPSAKMGAARSAAAEVNQYLNRDSDPETTSVFLRNSKTFSQEDIDAAIEKAAARHNVDANLVRSVIKVESNFNPNAVSRKGAMGLMQLMPQTARQLNVKNPFDPQQNVDAGVRHLKKLLESYGGDVKLTLAAYNAGSGAVARSAGIPRFTETQNYVRRITNLYYGGSEPGTHIIGNPVHDPVRVQRDARGVLYISNTD